MRFLAAIPVLLVVLGTGARSACAEVKTSFYHPSYVSPADLEAMLGARDAGGRTMMAWPGEGGPRAVEVRRNDAANLLAFTGEADDVAVAESMAKGFDVTPQQISLEARIVEIDTDKAHDLGIDWSALRSSANSRYDWNKTVQKLTQPFQERQSVTQSRGDVAVQGSLNDALTLFEQRGIATTRDAPRVLTLNNRPATILDGQRITFTTRANGYANLYAVDSMDAGLKLAVLPSMLEGGHLRLQLTAELTSLANVNPSPSSPFAQLAGSPIKQGQIVENTVIVKDGETVLLGGFTRTVDVRTRTRVPVLGAVLPFLFSRDVLHQSHRESFIALTPHVVDLDAGVDEPTRKTLEGK